MPRIKKGSVLVLVGTRKGAFLLTSDSRRCSWRVDGPHFPGRNVQHFTLDPRNSETLYATPGSTLAPRVDSSSPPTMLAAPSRLPPAISLPLSPSRPFLCNCGAQLQDRCNPQGLNGPMH